MAFILNKIFVFDSKRGNTGKQLFGFVAVSLLGLAQTLLLSLVFRNYAFPAIGFNFYPDAVAHFIGLGTTAFTSFLGHKYFSFNDSKQVS
jgi:putative flippase GtrA